VRRERPQLILRRRSRASPRGRRKRTARRALADGNPCQQAGSARAGFGVGPRAVFVRAEARKRDVVVELAFEARAPNTQGGVDGRVFRGSDACPDVEVPRQANALHAEIAQVRGLVVGDRAGEGRGRGRGPEGFWRDEGAAFCRDRGGNLNYFYAVSTLDNVTSASPRGK